MNMLGTVGIHVSVFRVFYDIHLSPEWHLEEAVSVWVVSV